MTVSQISRGNVVWFLAGCPCGRAFELDTRPSAIPAHICNAPDTTHKTGTL